MRRAGPEFHRFRVGWLLLPAVTTLVLSFGGSALLNHVAAPHSAGHRWGYLLIAAALLAVYAWIFLGTRAEARRLDALGPAVKVAGAHGGHRNSARSKADRARRVRRVMWVIAALCLAVAAAAFFDPVRSQRLPVIAAGVIAAAAVALLIPQLGRTSGRRQARRGDPYRQAIVTMTTMGAGFIAADQFEPLPAPEFIRLAMGVCASITASALSLLLIFHHQRRLNQRAASDGPGQGRRDRG